MKKIYIQPTANLVMTNTGVLMLDTNVGNMSHGTDPSQVNYGNRREDFSDSPFSSSSDNNQVDWDF